MLKSNGGGFVPMGLFQGRDYKASSVEEADAGPPPVEISEEELTEESARHSMKGSKKAKIWQNVDYSTFLKHYVLLVKLYIPCAINYSVNQRMN